MNYGTNRFNAEITRVLQQLLSRKESNKFLVLTLSSLRFNLTLSSHLRLGLLRSLIPEAKLSFKFETLCDVSGKNVF